MRDRKKVKKCRAQLRMPSLNQRIQKHGPAAHKKLPPQLPRLFECLRLERTNVETLSLECPRRIAHRLAGLCSYRPIVLEEADGNTLQILQGLIPEPNRWAYRVPRIVPGKSDEQQRNIADSASHRPIAPQNREGSIPGGQVTTAGNAARRGFE